MARLTSQNVELARTIIRRYPDPRSATIPLLHLAQAQHGWVTDEAMEHIAELLGLEAAEVLGTCSFYEMFKREPTGKYLVGVCTNIACMILGGDELLEHCEQRLGVKAGSTTADGEFTLSAMECLAACGGAPCLQVNYRYFENVNTADADRIIDDLRAGNAPMGQEVPLHGTLSRVALPEVRTEVTSS